MAYENPRMTNNGEGMLGSSATVSKVSGQSGNAMSDGGKTTSGGSAFSNNPSGPGAGANGGSPDPNLLSTGGAGGPGPGAGSSGPSPDQSLLSTKGSGGSAPRKPSFGGMEKGVQIP